MIWLCVLFSIFLQKNNCEIFENLNKTKEEWSSTNSELKYNSTISSTYNRIDVHITKYFSKKITCTGYVYEKISMKIKYFCKYDRNCKLCNSFNVTNLELDTTYLIDIRGSVQNFCINKLVTTDNLLNFTFQANDNSIDVFIKKLYPVSLNCEGNIWDVADNILVFDCSKSIHCKKCNNFSVDGLYSNTMYKFTIKSARPNFIKIENIITTYYLSSKLLPSYSSISVVVMRSINLSTTCNGEVYNKISKRSIFNCAEHADCQLCLNFTLTNLKENTEYDYKITSNPIGIYPKVVSTLMFWNVTIKSSFKTIYINITKLFPIDIKCWGYLIDDKNNKIFDCLSNKKCKKCISFNIFGLFPNTNYTLIITTSLKAVGIHKIIKTKDIFKVESNVSFFSISYELTKLSNQKMNCSGSIVEDKSAKVVFFCKNNRNCLMCNNFTVYGLTQNTTYKTLILVNNLYSLVNTTFKTKIIWEIKTMLERTEISIAINRFYKQNMFCTGNVVEIGQRKPIFVCSDHKLCSSCEEINVKFLKPQTKYYININSNINHTEINLIIETIAMVKFHYNVSFNEIRIFLNVSRSIAQNCLGNVYETATNKTVFNCLSDYNCSHCEDFYVTGLHSDTLYTIYIKNSHLKSYIFKDVKTDKYILEIKEITPHPTSVDLYITPNYYNGGICNLTLYDKFKNKLNMTCLAQCPSDCDNLNFSIINLNLSSIYTLEIRNSYLYMNQSIVFLFTDKIKYTLNLTYVDEHSFRVYPISNDTIKLNNRMCKFTVVNLQSGNFFIISNNCTYITVNNTEKGNSYKIFLQASLSIINVEPLLVYTRPIAPEYIEYIQLNNTALLVRAMLDISQPAPVFFKINLGSGNQSSILSKIFLIKYEPAIIESKKYSRVEAIIKVSPYILINVGTCTYINTTFCLTGPPIKFCSSCVYHRVPIFNISFVYPGDVRLVCVGESPGKLMMQLPKFNPANHWAIKCSIYVAKVLDSKTLTSFFPDYSNIMYGLYKENFWALLYHSYGFSSCRHVINITFGDKYDKNQLNRNFIIENLFYVGALQLCGYTSCVSSKMSNLELLVDKHNLKMQKILLISAMALFFILLLLIITVLILRSSKFIYSEIFDLKHNKIPKMFGT